MPCHSISCGHEEEGDVNLMHMRPARHRTSEIVGSNFA